MGRWAAAGCLTLVLSTLPWGCLVPCSEIGQSFGLCKERQLPGTQGGEWGRMRPGCVETSVSSLEEDAHPQLHQELCHVSAFDTAVCATSPLYVPGWTQVLSPRDLAFPSAWLSCSVIPTLDCMLHHCVFVFLALPLHPQLTGSITVSLAHLLHSIILSSLAPSPRLLFFLERQR